MIKPNTLYSYSLLYLIFTLSKWLVFVFILIMTSSCTKTIKLDKEYVDFCFDDVNIIFFDNDEIHIRQNQIVAIKDQKISFIGSKDSIKVDSRISKVEGHGKLYLIPGLVDAHTHITSLRDSTWLPLFLANGVTTVFNMRGNDEVLDIISKIESKKLLGPNIYSAGPLVQIPAVTTVEEAKVEFTKQYNKGFDFIKVYGNLNKDSYYEIGRMGVKHDNIAVVGHAPRNLSFDDVLKSNQTMISHLEELIYTKFINLDIDEFKQYLTNIKEQGLTITPTLTTYNKIKQQLGRPEMIDNSLLSDYSKYLIPPIAKSWKENNQYITRKPNDSFMNRALNFQKKAVALLNDANIRLLSGTDTPLPLVYPGFSLHEEFEILKESGLSSKDILKISIYNPGQYFKTHVSENEKFGNIKEGYRADLILLTNNPINDIEILKEIEGVMVNGQWLTQFDLEKMLIALEKKVKEWPNTENEEETTYSMNLDELKQFTGTYIQKDPFTKTKWYIKDGLLYSGEIDSPQQFKALPIGPNTFRFADVPVKLIAKFNNDRTNVILEMDGNTIGNFLKEQ